MPLGSGYLTMETAEQAITHPGQAHFAIPGDGRRCFVCNFWDRRHRSGNRAICLKAARMVGRETPKVPRDAVACKYFEERSHG